MISMLELEKVPEMIQVLRERVQENRRAAAEIRRLESLQERLGLAHPEFVEAVFESYIRFIVGLGTRLKGPRAVGTTRIPGSHRSDRHN